MGIIEFLFIVVISSGIGYNIGYDSGDYRGYFDGLHDGLNMCKEEPIHEQCSKDR